MPNNISTSTTAIPPSPHVRVNLRVRSGTVRGRKCKIRVRKKPRYFSRSVFVLNEPGNIEYRILWRKLRWSGTKFCCCIFQAHLKALRTSWEAYPNWVMLNCKFSISPGYVWKIPLNPPLQKGEAVGMPVLIEMLRSIKWYWVFGIGFKVFHGLFYISSLIEI